MHGHSTMKRNVTFSDYWLMTFRELSGGGGTINPE
jgi:hypothetical protein